VEFSYSTFFSDLVFEFIVIFEELYTFLEVFVFSFICPDTLYLVPRNASIAVISDLTIMGAQNFLSVLIIKYCWLFLIVC
jgi:hypothetical protein